MSDAGAMADILRRESRSYLQYVRESYPWAKGRDEQVREALLTIAMLEYAELQLLGRAMQKAHMSLPSLGGFPASFTTSNFIAVDFLIPRLIAAQKTGIGALEAGIAAVSDPDFQRRLHALVELKTKHLHELEALKAAPKAA
jgi:hypothetical protein